MMWWDIQ